jgi:uncharacterized membrane protein YqjE
MLQRLILFLQGKKTHLVSLLVIVIQVLHAQGYLTDKATTTLTGIGLAGGMMALRSALKAVAVQILVQVVRHTLDEMEREGKQP